MAQELTLNQGDTFIVNGLYTDNANVPIDLVGGGITVESYIKDRNNLKIALDVTLLGPIGTYLIESDTNTWPLGRVTWHVRYIDADNRKKSTEPVVINIEVG